MFEVLVAYAVVGALYANMIAKRWLRTNSEVIPALAWFDAAFGWPLWLFRYVCFGERFEDKSWPPS